MLVFTVRHKYCGMETKISGINVFQAFKNNKKDLSVWEVICVEEA